MRLSTTLRQHRGAGLVLALAVLLTACGSAGPATEIAAPPEPPASTTTADPSPSATATRAPDGVPRAVTDAATEPATPAPRFPDGVPAGSGLDPARISIPAIGVDASVIDLGYNPDGTMAVPEDFSRTGWFRHGPRPGELGASIIVGHIDSKTGPAVFYRLAELQPGQRVTVASEDGQTVTYEVETVEEYPKDAFPTEKVYRFTEDPTLRLITCGGPFDETIGHYENNTIVFARRVA